MSSPYHKQPRSAFWSKAIGGDYSPMDTVTHGEPLIRSDDLIVSAGSCFAANLVPHLERAGFSYLRTEKPHPAFARLPENLGYRDYSAAYGNVYSARQLRQLVERSIGRFRPIEDRWHVGPNVIDPFRPGLRYPARTDEEFEALTAQHLEAVRRAFSTASLIVLTLGLTETWVSALDGAAFPACPGTVAGTFDADRHIFINFIVDQVRDDLNAFIVTVREFNPHARFILTVSPVPMIATATAQHVLVANVYSKSVLRVAAGDVARKQPGVTYFPAYEIITGPQAPDDYYEPDRRHVSARGMQAVMDALVAQCDVPAPGPRTGDQSVRAAGNGHAASAAPVAFDPAALSRALADAECDEALLDVGS